MTSTTTDRRRILIIDDEENIAKALKDILSSKFDITVCHEPNDWGKYFEKSIDLVLLDLWMPTKDGFVLMKEIKQKYSELPVIMMSGHANIATSVELLKKGADDFIEKPFSYDSLLKKIYSVLKQETGEKFSIKETANQLVKEISTPQTTISKSVVLTGKGLHKGNNTGLILMPAEENTGIVFEDITTEQTLEANITNVAETNLYATTLKQGDFSLTVVEHLLSVLHVYGIDNLLIKVSEEIPIFDGSAKPFCDALADVKLIEQNALKKVIVIDKEYRLVDEKNPDIWISVAPYNGFKITYTLNLPPQFGDQTCTIDLSDDPYNTFVKEIAPCRTFGFLEEIKQLYAHGLAKGSDLETGILIDKDQVINTKLHFPNEFARHKVLDIIGDLYLLGCSFRGEVTAHYSGHRHTTLLQKQLLNLS